MAIQLAKAFGSKVIVTVGSKDKADACLKLGADQRHQLQDRGFRRRGQDRDRSARGANVILDMVGGDYVERNYDAAAVDGRIVQIALLGGAKVNRQFRQADGETAAPHRLDAAPP